MAYIFLHGLGQNSCAWKETIQNLNPNFEISCPDLFQMKIESKDCKAINCDNLNYNNTDHCGANHDQTDCNSITHDKTGRDDISYGRIYQQLDKYLKRYKEPFHLCGLSLGAMLAFNYAIDNPDKVKSLVVIGAQYKIPKKLMKFQNAIFKLLPNKVFDNMGLPKNDVLTLTKSMMDLNFEADLKKINCPVLILCGEKDRANKKAAIELSRVFADCQFEIIPKAGHEVNIHQAKRLAEILNHFYVS